jgi:hypothetical protein
VLGYEAILKAARFTLSFRAVAALAESQKSESSGRVTHPKTEPVFMPNMADIAKLPELLRKA